MKIQYKGIREEQCFYEVPDEEVKFNEDGYAVVKFPAPGEPETSLVGIVRKDGHQVIEPRGYHTDIVLLPNEMAIVHTAKGDVLNVSSFTGKHIHQWTDVSLVDLTVEKPRFRGEIMKLGEGYQVLPNGNLVLKNHEGQDDGIGDIIYNPYERKFVSEKMSHIGEFEKNEETGLCTAPVRLDIKVGENSRVSLYGKMDMNGEFGKELFNAATGKVINKDRRGFSLSKEVKRTKEYTMKKELKKARIVKDLKF